MDHTKQAEYFIVSGSVPKLANYLEKITGEAAEIESLNDFNEAEIADLRGQLARKQDELDDCLETYTDENRGRFKAERERDELAAALRWIPVEERLPEAPAWVLVYADGAMNCMWYFKGEWSDATAAHNIVISDITHWRPLPPPPPALDA